MAAEREKKYSKAEAKELIDLMFGATYVGRNEHILKNRIFLLRQDDKRMNMETVAELVADGWIKVKEFAVRHYERNY